MEKAGTPQGSHLKLVLVDWIDSHSGRGWRNLDDIDRGAEPLLCRSVGWLSMETDEVLLLIPHLAGEGQSVEIILQGCGEMCIPKSCVRRFVELMRRRTDGREAEAPPAARPEPGRPAQAEVQQGAEQEALQAEE